MPASVATMALHDSYEHQRALTWLAGLVEAARQAPNGQLEIRDQTGAVVATLQAHDLAKRPKDMPRALRPKQKLSKRQRAAVKRDKLTTAA